VVELCRYLSNLEKSPESAFQSPDYLFLSHTKTDLNKSTSYTAAQSNVCAPISDRGMGLIPATFRPARNLPRRSSAGFERNSLLAVLTDAYATRRMVPGGGLARQEHQRPVVVVDALTSYEVRSFPYVGNVPRIRWDGVRRRLVTCC